MQQHETLSHRVASFLDRRSAWFLITIAVITGLLVVPLLTMAPDEAASDNPGGEVYDLQDLIDLNLPIRVRRSLFIAEAKNGDFLTQGPLWELYQATEELRRADRDGELAPPDQPDRKYPREPYLFSGFNIDRQQPIVGVYTLADAVQEVLSRDPRLNTNLGEATDEQVKFAIQQILSDPTAAFLKNTLSQKKKVERRNLLGEEVDYWTSPALLISVAADNEKLGGGSLSIGGTADPITEGKEEFSRAVQGTLRGENAEESSYDLWGVAIDASLELAEEVGTAVPFIMATFVMVLVVVGISLRSARVVLLTAVGLVFMIIWLKGLSNLVGLKSSIVLDFIVPIAMISLGADFAIHAVHRYRQERKVVPDPRVSFRLGMAGVLGALALAMVTDAIAFLSNASADIETVVGLGVGAGLAVVAAFVILGLAIPVALMRLDAWRAKAPAESAVHEPSPSQSGAASRRWSLEGLVVALARWRLAVLPLTAVITVISAYYALQLDATFEVKDFFKRDSDFAVGLDKLEKHLGESGGEPAIIYIQGDLSDPAALSAIEDFLDTAADNRYVGKTEEGEATLQRRTIFSILEQVMRSEYARAQIQKDSGVSISTNDGISELRYDGNVFRRPDSQVQLNAIYDYVTVNGVPLSPTQNIYDALEVGETLYHDPTGASEDVTSLMFGIPGTAVQTNVVGSRETLNADIRLLEAAPAITRAGLTGSPYTRQAGLDATTDGLQRAFPLALVLCLLVAVVAMRSLRFGVVTIIPVVLVVTWLYGFMYVFGFGLNFVTVTIAAISIGVGVDYTIHMTQRYREELAKAADKEQALRRAARGTGVALLASAATSVAGFTIMAFAPMPMFSAYGILTAVMIFLAATASLLVLPSILLLVTPARPSEA